MEIQKNEPSHICIKNLSQPEYQKIQKCLNNDTNSQFKRVINLQ